MNLTFKMKVKLSLLVAFAFIIALIIHEDHAGVVLKKFKPRRTLSSEAKPKVDSIKKPSKPQILDKDQNKTTAEATKNVSLIKDSSSLNNNTVGTFETIGKEKLFNSSVVYVSAKDTVSNSNTSKLSRSLTVENVVNRNNSNCSSDKDQNCSTTISDISAEMNKTKENSSHISESNSVVQDLSTDIPVSSEKFSNGSTVSQQEKYQLETVSDNHTAESPGKEIKTDESLKQPSTNNTKSLDVSQPSIYGHLNLSSANLQDSEIISENNSALQSVTESEILQKNADISDSENTITNEIVEKTVHKSNSAGLEFSAQSEATKNDSSDMKIVNEFELIKEQDDRSDSENTLANNTPLNQTVQDSIALAGLEFSSNSDPSRNDNSVTQLVNESETLQKDDSSGSETISTNETLLNQTGLESIVSAGLDFLANSEVAKNAAVAMEIFNLSDSSLTDHIIDDSVIDLVLPPLSTENKLATETASSEIEVIKNDLIPSNQINESHINTDEVESDINVLPVDKKKCPTPGICVFWFITQNACTNDSDCLGSKICCRVRCSKKCIDV